ncbi:MAG: hypothetical protein LBC71_06905, partial [Oscillospiraceae bacterium]|nr:hypothetical protein [Oscillospiraceae bacterium]
KNTVPRITVELYDGINPNPIAKGNLLSWEEDREDFEVEFTCVDELKEILDEPVSKVSFTKHSDSIIAKEQPPGPGDPPEGGVPPINPPGLPMVSYHKELQEFFWDALSEWWNSIKGDAPAFIQPPSLPPNFNGLSIMSCFVGPINQRLQSFNSGTYRVQIRFRQLSEIERKLSEAPFSLKRVGVPLMLTT